MKYEVEICVKYFGTKEEILEELERKGFKVLEAFKVKDTYMINKNIDIHSISALDYLSKCVAVREFSGVKKVLQYKFKDFNEKGEIIRQGKIHCPITDIDKGIEFLQALDYNPIFTLNNDNYIYTNGKNEIYVQFVDDLGIYIEMEQDNIKLSNVNGNTVDEMKKVLMSYNFNIDTSNFFAKKAADAFNKLIKTNKAK